MANPNSPIAPSPLSKDEPQAGSIVRGNSKPRRISAKTGRQQVAGIYCQPGQRSRYGVPRGSKSAPFGACPRRESRAKRHWLTAGTPPLKSSQARDLVLKSSRLACAHHTGKGTTMALFGQDQEPIFRRNGLDRSRRRERSRRHHHDRCLPAGDRRRSAGRASRPIGRGRPDRILRLVPGKRQGVRPSR